ncbi:MAG: SDR family NAD(P)-dependent oxidoreductase, partial [Clostridiales Family XIII bacterium]|nr:SDR family NAD(P)-dependent oxidoreductase [Clostridiales Family XIII bacterium]
MNAIVTGYGGIAYEAALSLAKLGYDVILAGRDPAKGEAAAARLRRTALAPADIVFEPLDLFEPASIRGFAKRIADTHDHIDIVMCVAGIMMPSGLSLSSQGVERQFAVNYLGHFELVGRLLLLIRKSESPRVVTVSS